MTKKRTYSASCGHVCIDRKGLAATEEQVIHSGQLAVKPNVHIDDWHALQPFQLAEIGFGLPPLWDDPLDHINCKSAHSQVVLH